MEKKIRLGIIFLITIIGIVFFVQYIAFNAQKNSRADTAPTISLSIEQGATQKVVIVKAKLSSGAVNIINYNFHVLFNTASTVTDITYSIGAASAGLGDSNGNLTAVNARTGTNRYIKIFGELGSLTPAPLSASYQEVVRITFDTNQTGTMISIPNDQNFTFTAYNPTTFVNTPLAIVGGPFSLEGGTSSSSSSSSSSSRSSQSSSSSTGRSSAAIPEQVKSNGDLLNINSSPLDRAPFRYEQQVTLNKGTYLLKASALIYVSRGRGVLVALACAENNCGNGKTLNAIIAQTPIFSVSTDYKEQSVDIDIPEAGKNKKYMVRIFTEDGSEADFDYVSLTNQWDGEQLQNIHFAQTQDTSISRKHPQNWELDASGKLFGTVDPNKGVGGALYINSISRL